MPRGRAEATNAKASKSHTPKREARGFLARTVTGSRFSRFAFFFFLPDTTGPFLCRGALGGRIDSDVDAEIVRDDPDDFFGGHA